MTVLFEGQEISVPVTVGLTADSMVEISSSQLMEGDTVVVFGSTTTTSTTSESDFRGPGGFETFGGPPAGMP